MSDEKKGVFAKIKSIKHIEIIIAIVAVVLMLLIYFSALGKSSKSEKGSDPIPSKTYCELMQEQLQSLISSIDGVGKAKVLINWESSVEYILAESTSNSTNSTTSTPQLIQSNGQSSPIIIKELYPKAIGVFIVCQGGADARIKISIIMAVSTLLDIPQDKIIVTAMSK